MKIHRFTMGCLATLVLFSGTLFGQSSIRVEPFITSGLSSPLYMTTSPLPPGDRSRQRHFIVQQGGIIQLYDNQSNRGLKVFLNMTSRVLSGGERGLLGLAFHPQYLTNRKFYVYYTRTGDGAVQISEFLTSATNPDAADPTSERVLVTVPQPASNHNGGTLAFGPDGYLYAAPGDGGGANDTGNNAQNLNVLLGKMIRIDVDNVPPGQNPPYNIPPTNPFVGMAGVRPEIYAYGLRNPYRFSFDRDTGQLWLGDVGQGAREEVDIIISGGNYGWRIMEGNICTPGVNPNCTPPAGYVPPVFDYVRGGGRCSVVGGYVYRGPRGTFPTGSYVYGDYCSGEIFLYNNNPNQPVVLLDTPRNIAAFAEDEFGELYIVGLGGTIEKIVPNP